MDRIKGPRGGGHGPYVQVSHRGMQKTIRHQQPRLLGSGGADTAGPEAGGHASHAGGDVQGRHCVRLRERVGEGGRYFRADGEGGEEFRDWKAWIEGFHGMGWDGMG